ncbi:MAG: FAD-binding protein [Deltaproteobacteria bacterium]|nr:FAD-binding protein [Deltaproteobacteria bacterium]
MTAAQADVTWERVADVVVLGYGGAGACAAIAAHDAGVKVLLIEKAPFGGGNTACALGPMRLPGDVAGAVKYYQALSFGTVADEDLIWALAEALHDLPGKLDALGVPLKLVSKGSAMFPTLPGAEALDHWMAGTGNKVFEILAQNVEKRGIPVLYGTRARKLVQDPATKAVLGVVIEKDGKEEAIRANRGVILSTGGYENDPQLQGYYNFPGVRLYPFGTPYNTGDGVRMAAAVGADPWHFVNVAFMGLSFKGPADQYGCAFPFQKTRGGFIFVNKTGRRFMNEAKRLTFRKEPLEVTYFDHEAACYPNLPCYLIFDETQRLKGPLYRMTGGMVGYASIRGFDDWSEDNSAEIAKGWIIKANTLEELAARTGIDPTGLKQSVGQNNKDHSAQADDAFGRPADSRRLIVTPPYYAAEFCLSIVNTQGGPRHNRFAQTLDTEGNIIPRLYTPGELGSFFGHLYQGGSNLPEALAFGRIAGECAAKEKPW